MLPIERKNLIKELLLVDKSVSVVSLAGKFSVTEETIRRDLKALETEGVAERTHGGAIIAERTASSFNRNLMKGIMPQEKKAMASLTRPFVKNGFCIYLDSSTTVQYVLPLLENVYITVVSNSVDVSTQCANMENIKLIALGGIYNHRTRCFSGNITNATMQNYYFDLSIVSCRTLNIEQGLTDSEEEDAIIKRNAINQSKNTILLADHTKFDKISFVKVCDITQVDVLITDQNVSSDWKTCLAQNKIELLYPEATFS